jgi:metal-responsive CopG/Arc/MetJ family transcriptional regulator
MRALMDIPDNKIDALTKVCERAGISRAEAVRRAIDAFIQANTPKTDEAFGLWKTRPIDGVEYENGMREEW